MWHMKPIKYAHKLYHNKKVLVGFVALVVVLGVSIGYVKDAEIKKIALNRAYAQLQSLRTIVNDVWDKANHRLMITSWAGAQQSFETETTIFNDVWDAPNHRLRTSSAGGEGGSGAFSDLTTGTNSTAAMTVGTGASLGTSGSGTIAATSVPAAGISGNIAAGQLAATSVSAGSYTYASLTVDVQGRLTAASNGVTPATAATTVTIAGTTNEISSSAGAQDLSTNRTWTLSLPSVVDFSGKTLRLPNSTTLPGTCTVGNVYFDNDATAGLNIYGCTATNTWTLQAGNSGGSVTVKEADNSPNVGSVATIVVPNTSLTDNGSGQVTLSLPTLAGANTFTGQNVFNNASGQDIRKVNITGSTSGSISIQAPATASGTITLPNGTTDFSATGGTSNVLKQVTVGAPITVGALVPSDVGLGNVDNTSDATKNSATAVLENKHTVPRSVTCTPSANTITPNADTTDICEYYSLGANTTIANPTATGSNPRLNQRLEIVLLGAAQYTLSFGSNYDATCGIQLPTEITGDGVNEDHFLFKYKPSSGKWCILASTRAAPNNVTTLTSSSTYTCPRTSASTQCEMQMTGAAGTLTVAAPTGVVKNGDVMILAFMCTNAQTFSWNAGFANSANVTAPSTCPADTNKWTMVGVRYSSVLTKWQVLATN